MRTPGIEPPAATTRQPAPTRPARARLIRLAAIAALTIAGTLIAMAKLAVGPEAHAQSSPNSAPPAKASRASLTVETVLPETVELATRINATGNIAAWQEAIIGAEVNGLRLSEVRVNVGDVVKAGTLLATFASETVLADLALQRATLAEAEANLADARANADRGRQVQASGALSAQQVGQLLTAEATARARVDAARAQLQSQELRLKHTRIEAPDSGIISVRSATVGAVAQPGQELFRLIRQGRLEWRAEVASAQLHQLRPGQPVRVIAPSGEALEGRIRMVGPTVDGNSRNALVYVDLRGSSAAIKAGMFVRGEIDLGASRALTVPQSAVLLREGFTYVYRVDESSRVAQIKVDVGRREGDRIEILRGLDPGVRVVRSGVGFLADGDTVRVAERPATAPAAAAPAAQKK